MRFVVVFFALLFFLMSSFSFASSESIKVRRLVSLEKIYKKNTASNKAKLKKAKELRKNKDIPIVAVLDSGVHYKDPSIAYKILRPEETKLAGYLTANSDDSLNGCIGKLDEEDYEIGVLKKEIKNLKGFFYKAYLKSIDHDDSESHGTIISRIISKSGGDVLILPMVCTTGISVGFEQYLAIELAAKQGASIINMSLIGSGEENATLENACRIIADKAKKYPSILFVLCSGNEGRDLDGSSFEVLNLPNVILVGAVDSNGILASYSNYGSRLVDVAASGKVEWFSEYKVAHGTSYASPRVAGLAAKIKRINPGLSAKQIKKIICSTSSKKRGLRQKVKYGGVINKKRSLEKARATEGIAKGEKDKNLPDCFLDIFDDGLLYLAANNCYNSLVHFLIDKDVDVNKSMGIGYGGLSLAVASHFGCEGAVRMLIDKGVDVDASDELGQTALYLASEKGNENVVQMLVDAKADVDKVDNSKTTPLYIASQNGFEGIVKILVDANADLDIVDKDGFTAVYAACVKGYKDILQLLVDYGAEVDMSGNNGITPMSVVAQNNYKNMVSILFDVVVAKKGSEAAVAYIDKERDDGATPLSMAVTNGHGDMVQMLIDRGGDVKRSLHDGTSPLHLAAYLGYENIAKMLVDAVIAREGLKAARDYIKLPTLSGHDSVALADSAGYTNIARMLKGVLYQQEYEEL